MTGCGACSHSETQFGGEFELKDISLPGSDVLRRAEIRAWWSASRGLIDRECSNGIQQIQAEIRILVADMSLAEVSSKKARAAISVWLQSSLESFSEVLAKRILKNLTVSVQKIGGFGDPTTLAASKAAGIGAGGAGLTLSGLATALSTTTVSGSGILGALGLSTVTVFSWPIFLTAGAASLSLVGLSHAVRKTGEGRYRRRLAEELCDYVEKVIGAAEDPDTIRGQLLLAVDNERITREAMQQ